MPEKVTLDEDLGIVRIESYGDVTAEDLRATLASALRIHQERGLTRGFVDETKVTSYPSTFSIHDFGLQAAELLRGIKVAIAAHPGIITDPGFFETVARNRGANLRVFDSPDAALAWLTKEQNP
ncbi:MAG: hypothetical protein GY786_12370 [Proteobacteria bacterium]|nr:hypothetical protein [Pseudomonadota bacterium]